MNDLPSCCEIVYVLLFTDDTNISAIGCSVAKVQQDLAALNEWLNANILVLNHKKTFQLNFNEKKAASNCSQLSQEILINKPVCKYLVI